MDIFHFEQLGRLITILATRDCNVDRYANVNSFRDCFRLKNDNIYKSVLLAILTGIVLSSVLIQRNSPDTHMVVKQTRLMHHQVRVWGSPRFHQMQPIKCSKWTVQEKSKHSFVL